MFSRVEFDEMRAQPLESGKPQGPLPPQSEELSLPDDDNYLMILLLLS